MEVNLRKCRTLGISPNQYVMLMLIQERKFDVIKALFSKEEAFLIRLNLTQKGFVISDENCKFIDTILSQKMMNKLLGIRNEKVNFWEFYSSYPIKVGSRVLRSAGPDSKLAQKHEKKYIRAVKTVKEHELAVRCLNAFVDSQKASGKLAYLPQMERILNNNMWETWEPLLTQEKEENWDNDTI
jgi:hypothetical protein